MRRELVTIAGQSPYLATIPDHIAQHDFVVSPEVALAAAQVHSEIARFGGQHGYRYDLDFSLAFMEGTASAQMEGIHADAADVALVLERLGSASRDAALSASGIRAVNQLGNEASLDGDAIIRAHHTLLGSDEEGRLLVGGWREQRVWIGGPNPESAIFVPPTHQRVPSLMLDLAEFVRRTDILPIVHAAVAHAQFETIHPFPDGNGRIGRALATAMLRQSGVAEEFTAFPISLGLKNIKRAYIDALTAYREGDPSPIVEVFVNALELSLGAARKVVSYIDFSIGAEVEVVAGRSDSTARRALDVLFEMPVFDIGSLADHLDVSDVAAGRAIRQLERSGVVERIGTGMRNRRWLVRRARLALELSAEIPSWV